jgi:pimeloyl-ACP methyl ester carboxylesterase
MDHWVTFRDTDVHFKTFGEKSGGAVILLHGYLESADIWNGFATELSKDFFVTAIDLPGHGKSGVYANVHRMDDMAESVIAVADMLGIDKFHLVGHSMGGYVTMAFREHHFTRLLSCVLFHSTCFADSDEKKVARSREIELVKQGKKDLIVKASIPKEFANDNQERFAGEIERAIKIASETPGEGIIAALNGMMARSDRSALLKENRIPLLLVGGKKDNHIPFAKMEEMQAMGGGVKLYPLSNSGHMGFIEERDESLKALTDFFSHTGT